jgi:hypothetical protein
MLGWLGCLVSGALLSLATASHARPNTHAPAISTWDPRASSVVVGLGGAVSGDGAFAFKSYNANFSSSDGILSAQFGVHYVTFKDSDTAALARGVSAGGVALISLPLTPRFENGVPGTSFAFYVGGVPTAVFSGQLNYISVPLVLGVGLPYSPIEELTLRPWVELSPGLNFDTRIEAVATSEAVQSAMDGTLTRDEVEDLVKQGLKIDRETSVGKRVGISASGHLGERVDIDVNWMLGAGHAGAMSLGASLVVRWDAMVGVSSARREEEDEDCDAIARRYHQHCPLRRPASAPAAPSGAAPVPSRVSPPSRRAPDARGRVSPMRPNAVRSRDSRWAPAPATPARSPSAAPASDPAQRAAPAPQPAPQPRPSATQKKAAPQATPQPTPAPARPKPDALPPLQAAPPRSP